MDDALASSSLGAFLKDRRARLNPASVGLPSLRRRTPGLRREEVAQRANVSAVWYTWLEQGRGGAPSADVLQRLSNALALTSVEREHLFLLAQGRPPQAVWRGSAEASPQLQHLLDSLETSPTMAKTPLGEVVAWNRAAAAVFLDFGALPPGERNMLRLMFLDPALRRALPAWEATARRGIAAFRLHLSRTGASEGATALVRELAEQSADFARLWRENEVSGVDEPVMTIDHPVAGRLLFETYSLVPDGRPDLMVIVRTPLGPDDRAGMRRLLAAEG